MVEMMVVVVVVVVVVEVMVVVMVVEAMVVVVVVEEVVVAVESTLHSPWYSMWIPHVITVAQKTAPMFAYYIKAHVLLNADII